MNREFWDKLKVKDDLIKAFEYMPLSVMINKWLQNLKKNTQLTYGYNLKGLIRKGILPLTNGDLPFTVSDFNGINHYYILELIKSAESWTEKTKQTAAACYISLTSYISELTNGWFVKARPSKYNANPTFYKIYDKCQTGVLNLEIIQNFFLELQKINKRDSLIARTQFQGAKRISEVVNLTLDQIDWNKDIIKFYQLKTRCTFKEIPISYPPHFMNELREYINKTAAMRKKSKYVFVSRNGKKLCRTQLNHTFGLASRIMKLKITPHVLRASWITMAKGMGVTDSEIMKVTGHASANMIYFYDKTAIEENFTKKLSLI